MISNDELQARILAEVEECAATEILVPLLNTVIIETRGRPKEVTLFRQLLSLMKDKLAAKESDKANIA